MSLSIQKNGEDFVNFESAMCSVSMENLCGHFSITSTANPDNLFPVKVEDSVKIIVDGSTVLTGFVEVLTESDDKESHDIILPGRGKLCDLIDSSLREPKEYSGLVSLNFIIQTVLDDIGVNVDIIDDLVLASNPPFDAWDIESVGIGESGFSFIEKLARKRQILLTSDGDGNLVLTRGGNTTFPANLKKKINGTDNNILYGSLTVDHRNIFNEIIVSGQLNPINQPANVRPKDLVSVISSPAVNNTVRRTRQLVINSEENLDGFTANQRAIWEANIRRARSLSYSPTVQGHSANGEVWRNNVIVPVDDDFAGLHGDMRIKTVTYLESVDNGSTTRLDLTFKDAYTLQAEQDARDALNEDW